MPKIDVVPPRSQGYERDPGFSYIRAQNLPNSMLAGQDPVYTMQAQLAKHVPGASYEKVKEESNDVFTVFRIPKEDSERLQRALHKEANDRVTRHDDTGIKSTTNMGVVAPLDKIDQTPQTLDQVGNALPIE